MGKGTSKAGGGSGGAATKQQNQFMKEIARAKSLDELDDITERAANEIDDNAVYTQVYQAALNKAQSWQPAENGSIGGSNNKPKTMRELQIEALEKKWGGDKAIQPDSLKVGDVIGGIQYNFVDGVERPGQTKGTWSGDYNGVKMSISSNNTFEITSVKVGKTSTEITAERLGGASGIIVKKKIPNDKYMRVYKRGNK